MKMRMLVALFAAMFILAACNGRQIELPGVNPEVVEVTVVVRDEVEVEVEVTRLVETTPVVEVVEVTRLVETTPVVVEDPTPTDTPEPTGTPAPAEEPEDDEPLTEEELVDSGHPQWLVEAYQDLIEERGVLVTNEDILWISPEMQEEGSWPPGAGIGHFDLGVEEGEITLVFGVYIQWEGLEAGNADWESFDQTKPIPGCGLVVLTPGFYPDLGVVDGRYENYRLPERDLDGWITVLATHRMEEQSNHYDCPDTMDHVEVWSGDPLEKPWAERRRWSGVDYLIPFYKGDEVFGFAIYDTVPSYTPGSGHDTEPICDGGGCYLAEAPFDGACGGCVINSWWEGEIPPNAKEMTLDD